MCVCVFFFSFLRVRPDEPRLGSTASTSATGRLRDASGLRYLGHAAQGNSECHRCKILEPHTRSFVAFQSCLFRRDRRDQRHPRRSISRSSRRHLEGCTHTHTLKHIHSNIHTLIHTHSSHIHIHTDSYTFTHTYSHTHSHPYDRPSAELAARGDGHDEPRSQRQRLHRAQVRRCVLVSV